MASTQPPAKFQRFAPELNAIKEYPRRLARLINPLNDKFKLGQAVDEFPQLYELLRRMCEQLALQQDVEPVTLDYSFLTEKHEKDLRFARQLVPADSSITLTPRLAGSVRQLAIAAAGGGFPMDLTTSYIYDDFRGGTDVKAADRATLDFEKFGSIGQLGWFLSVDGGTADNYDVFYSGAATASNPGIASLRTDTAAGSRMMLSLVGCHGVPGIFPDDLVLISPTKAIERHIFNAGGITATGKLRIGLKPSTVNVFPADPPAGIYLELDRNGGDTNFYYVYDDGAGGHNRTDSGVAVDSLYHLLKIRYDAGSSVFFSLDDGAETEVSTASSYAAGHFVEVNHVSGGVGDIVRLDFFDSYLTGLTRY